MIPRLNQLCDIKTVTRNHRGSKTENLIASDVPCRFTKTSSRIQNGQGEYIDIAGSLHMNNDPFVNKGMYVNVCGKDYKVMSSTHTRDLNGNVKFQYIELQEYA